MENKRDRHFTEEEIEDKIVQSAEGMEVPDSLKPENIEKKLAQKRKNGHRFMELWQQRHVVVLLRGQLHFPDVE